MLFPGYGITLMEKINFLTGFKLNGWVAQSENPFIISLRDLLVVKGCFYGQGRSLNWHDRKE